MLLVLFHESTLRLFRQNGKAQAGREYVLGAIPLLSYGRRMSRLSQYYLAIQPRRALWFLTVVSALAVGALAYLVVFPARHATPGVFKAFMMVIVYLTIGIVALFFSGFAVWEKEKRINEDKWRGLNHATRLAVVEALKGSEKLPAFEIFNSAAADCQRLGADLYHAVSEVWSVPFPPITHQVPLASGIMIVATVNEPRAALLQAALKKLGIQAEVERADQTQFNIQIGPKVS